MVSSTEHFQQILPSRRDVLKETLVTVTEGNQQSKKRAIWRRVEQENSTGGCVGGVVAALAREIVTTDMSQFEAGKLAIA